MCVYLLSISVRTKMLVVQQVYKVCTQMVLFGAFGTYASSRLIYVKRYVH